MVQKEGKKKEALFFLLSSHGKVYLIAFLKCETTFAKTCLFSNSFFSPISVYWTFAFLLQIILILQKLEKMCSPLSTCGSELLESIIHWVRFFMLNIQTFFKNYFSFELQFV